MDQNRYKEFQRYKHHPEVAKQLQGGECIAYGARLVKQAEEDIPDTEYTFIIPCGAGQWDFVIVFVVTKPGEGYDC